MPKVPLNAQPDVPGQLNVDSINDVLARVAEAEDLLKGVRDVLKAAVKSEHTAGEETPTDLVEDATEEEKLQECLHNEIAETEAIKMLVPEIATLNNVSEAKVMAIFDIFIEANDSHTGYLTRSELHTLLVDMCDGAIDQVQLNFIMDKFDKDRDNALHFQEFAEAFMHTPLMKVAVMAVDVKNRSTDARTEIQEARIRLKPEDWVQMMGCRGTSIKNYVRKEIEESGSCLAMPLVFLMFILFFVSCFLHLGYEELHAVDDAIFFDITENANFGFGGDLPYENGRMGHKNLFDVNSFGDFWSWFSIGITPIFWAEGWDLSEIRSNVGQRCTPAAETLQTYGWNNATVTQVTGSSVNQNLCPNDPVSPQRPKDFYAGASAGTYLYYNSVVGGIRMRQERTPTGACPNKDGELMTALHLGLCVPNAGYTLRPEFHAALQIDDTLIDQPGGRTIYLPALAGQSKIRAELWKLENEIWLSPETTKIEILFTTYNAHLDIFAATYIYFFVNRGGHMFKMVQPISTYLTPYRDEIVPYCYIVDILLVILCLKIICEECIEICKSCKSHGVKAGLREYLAPANFIDWLSVIYFFFLMSFWLVHIGKIAELQDALRHANPKLEGSFSNAGHRDTFYAIVDQWVISDNSMRIVTAVFPFIIGMRFFKVFSLQPRLGVVTSTLACSFRDIIHFLMVFGSIFLVFVTAAMILFGRQLDDFTNFGRAVTTVFKIMLGDYEWDEMVRVGRQQAAVWFWSFTWLVNLIMLNMLLAIIMDVYTEVKGHISADAETMWSQVGEISRRWVEKRKGNRIDLQTILDALEEALPDGDAKEKERVTLEAFMEMIPTMPQKQAERLLVNTYNGDDEQGNARGMSMSETSSRVQHIFKNTQILHGSVERLMHMNEMMADMISSNFKEMRFHNHHHKQAIGELSSK